VADRSEWGSVVPEGRGRGIAAHFTFGSYAAQVAEVSVSDGGTIRVHRVVAGIDCGIPVNPSGIRAQVERDIVYGLNAALSGEITIKDGRVQQSNFHDYPVLRINQMPDICHLSPRTTDPHYPRCPRRHQTSIGNVLTRRPVSAANAFTTAGAIGGVPGSPTPPGGSVLCTMYTSTSGISPICSSL